MIIEELIVYETDSLRIAMEKMDKSGKQIIYIINIKNQLTGVLSDGDIRRWILKEKADIQRSVSEVMNKNPIYVKSSDISQAKLLMKNNNINSIAVIDDSNILTTIIFESEQIFSDLTITKNIRVVIMAGGKGTRLLPYTQIIPKPLIPIGDIPIIQRIMNKFQDYGMNNFLLSVNYKKNMIKSYFEDLDKQYSIKYIEEEIPLGTGGSLSLMVDELNESFFVSNCDILIEADYSDIVKFHKNNHHDVTIIASLKNQQISYGVLKLDEDGLLESTVEKPEFSYLINTGMYLLNKDIINYIPKNISIDLPTVIMKAKLDGKKIGVYPVSENSWLDMGQVKEMEQMIEKLGVD